jgi:hypothetical protein
MVAINSGISLVLRKTHYEVMDGPSTSKSRYGNQILSGKCPRCS